MIAPGFCHCGCGLETKISPKTNTARGWVAGTPRTYLQGHHARGGNPIDFIVDGNGCWIWQRTIHSDSGYAVVRDPAHDSTSYAHRVIYEQVRDPIPEGLDLDHLCRVRHCVNPDHLEPVTRAVNVQRGALTKLTAQEVAQIREQFRRFGRTVKGFAREHAEEYGVRPAAIIKLLEGRSWEARTPPEAVPPAEWPN